MDLFSLDKAVDRYFQSALAPTSRRTYASAQQRYLRFCTFFRLPPLPVLEHQLCRFVSYLAEDKLTHATIKNYLAAVRHMQIASGLPDPDIANMPKLEGVIRGIKSIQAREQQSKRTRLPITPHILHAMGAVWEAKGATPDHAMLWAAVTLSFFGFLRSGEVTVPSDTTFDPTAHLTVNDISVNDITNPLWLKLHLKASKTDPYRKGVDIVVGRTNSKLCPVAAVLAYVATRGNSPGFLFRFQDGRLLTKGRFVEEVREAVKEAGFDPTVYAGHSFRIGAATTASACGLSDSMIKMLGRWSSSAYTVYIKTPREQLASVSAALGQVLL